MLTEDDIRDIRRRFAGGSRRGGISPTALAGYFGLSRESIYRIARHDAYAWVPDLMLTLCTAIQKEETCNSGENIEEVTHGQSRNRAVR